MITTTGAMWYAVWQAQQREKIERRAELERQVLRIAMMSKGRITAVDVATHRAETVAEVEDVLRALHRDGYCESELTSEGNHIYIFRSFDDTPQRSRALEKEILRLAKIHNGLLKVTDVVMSTDLSFQEARQWLEQMVAQNICQLTDIPEGYRFFSTNTELTPPENTPLPLPQKHSESDSPFDAFMTNSGEPTEFIYDTQKEDRARQPRLPQKSG